MILPVCPSSAVVMSMSSPRAAIQVYLPSLIPVADHIYQSQETHTVQPAYLAATVVLDCQAVWAACISRLAGIGSPPEELEAYAGMAAPDHLLQAVASCTMDRPGSSSRTIYKQLQLRLRQANREAPNYQERFVLHCSNALLEEDPPNSLSYLADYIHLNPDNLLLRSPVQDILRSSL